MGSGTVSEDQDTRGEQQRAITAIQKQQSGRSRRNMVKLLTGFSTAETLIVHSTQGTNFSREHADLFNDANITDVSVILVVLCVILASAGSSNTSFARQR